MGGLYLMNLETREEQYLTNALKLFLVWAGKPSSAIRMG